MVKAHEDLGAGIQPLGEKIISNRHFFFSDNIEEVEDEFERRFIIASEKVESEHNFDGAVREKMEIEKQRVLREIEERVAIMKIKQAELIERHKQQKAAAELKKQAALQA